MGCIKSKHAAAAEGGQSLAIKWPLTFNAMSNLPVDTSVVNNIASELDSDGNTYSENRQHSSYPPKPRRHLISLPEYDESDEVQKSHSIFSTIFARFGAGQNNYLSSPKKEKWVLEEDYDDIIETVQDPVNTITV